MTEEFNPLDPTESTWAVVCTAKENPSLVLAFAAYHRFLGAKEVHLYLDEPNQDLADALSEIPDVFVTQCDRKYWKKRREDGVRPRAQEMRQLSNGMDAYRRTQADWLMNIDADEFVHPSRRLGEELAFVPPDIHFLRIQNVERAYVGKTAPDHIFEGAFRVPFERRAFGMEAIFGHTQPFMHRGVSAYCVGKSVVRTGNDDVLLGIHSPRVIPGRKLKSLNSWHCSSAMLLHFDGLTPRHWQKKLQAYAQNARYRDHRKTDPNRVEQILFVQKNAEDADALERLHTLVKVVSDKEHRQLKALGLLLDVEFSVAEALRLYGLTDRVDLSVAAFDSATADQIGRPSAVFLRRGK